MKSPKMNEILDRISKNAFGREGSASQKKFECVVCGEKVNGFKDALSLKEFSISGMCQTCQDKFFDEE